MTTPLVSVVMSVYNGENDLHRSIGSILDQSFTDFEFIIINDGSSDNTRAILGEYVAKDPRIRVVNQKNQGLTKSLIRGCELAQGNYIARQDSDDVSLSHRLEKQVQLLEKNSELVLASCATEWRGPDNEVLEVIRREIDPRIATQLLLNEKQGPPAHGTAMFRKDSYNDVGGYREEFYYGQDADLWLRMCENGLVGYVDDVLYRYFFHPGNISTVHEHLQAKFGKWGQACRTARKEGREEAAILKQASELTKEIRHQRCSTQKIRGNKSKGNYFIGALLATRKDRRAIKYLRQSIKEDPLNYRAWIRLADAFVRCRSVPMKRMVDSQL